MVVWLAGILLLAGIGLLALGWWGSPRNNHPHCRKCRFDLHGLWPGATVCPECGRGLGDKLAIRLGRRRPRRWLVALGCVVALAGAGIGGALAWGWSNNYNWDRHKPASWLIADLRSSRSVRLNAAARELERRALADELAGPHAHEIAEIVIGSAQAHDDPIPPPFGDLFTAMWEQDLLEPVHFDRFAASAFRLVIAAPARTRGGASMPVITAYHYGDFGQRHNLFGSLNVAWKVTATIDGVAVAMPPSEDPLFYETQLFGSSGQGGGPPYLLGPLPEARGPHRVEFACTIEMVDRSTGRVVTLPLAVHHTVTVVPPDQPLVELVDDPDLSRALLATARASAEFRVDTRGGRQHGRLFVRAGFRPDPPIDVFAEVFVRWGDHEERYGTLEWYDRSGQFLRGQNGGVIAIDEPPTHVDIILRPNTRGAEEAGRDRIFGSELVIEQVPVVPEQ